MKLHAGTIQISAATDILQTEEIIEFIKSDFGRRLGRSLNISKISAPVIVPDGTGINDDLNGIERPVRFPVKSLDERTAVIIQSLAKWKRMRLKYFEIEAGKGILTDMRALRPDEKLSPIHSIYVDQWDWEKHIYPEQRTLLYLKSTVDLIYQSIRATEEKLFDIYPWLIPQLPASITFIHSEELLRMYPHLNPKQRENEAAHKFGAIFITGIGNKLSNGEPHDGRAPDYDDWSSVNEDGFNGLNGDIIFWNPVLNSALEISSMGIRVNRESMRRQLKICGCQEREKLLFHRMLLDGQLPLSIGGGIGQSRLCMFLMKKTHIGEVQSSIWPDEILMHAEQKGIKLL